MQQNAEELGSLPALPAIDGEDDVDAPLEDLGSCSAHGRIHIL